MTSDLALFQSIANVADLIDCVAQREAYRRATEMIGPALERVEGRMSAGALDGIVPAPTLSRE